MGLPETVEPEYHAKVYPVVVPPTKAETAPSGVPVHCVFSVAEVDGAAGVFGLEATVTVEVVAHPVAVIVALTVY